MSQDATKTLLGATKSSDKEVTVYSSDPATYLAGLAVRISSAGLLGLTKSTGEWAGISLGKSLSDTKKTSVVRCGMGVPVKLALKRASGVITITNYANLVSGTDDTVTVAGVVFTAQAGAASPGAATFQAASSNANTAESLKVQINAHATAGALVRAQRSGAIVTVYAIVEGVAGNALTLDYTDNDANIGATISNTTLENGSDSYDDIDYLTIGGQVYIDDYLGKATDGAILNTTVSNAVYVSDEVLSGVTEAGTLVPVAIVDMVGGL